MGQAMPGLDQAWLNPVSWLSAATNSRQVRRWSLSALRPERGQPGAAAPLPGLFHPLA